jgi:integrase
MKLSKATVDALRLDGRNDLIVFDDTLKGFGVRLQRGSGGKVLRSFIVQWKHGGATRRLRIGSVEVLGAEEARKQAKKILGRVAIGEDPSADKRERAQRDRLQLRSVIDDYLAQKKVSKRTLRDLTRYLTGGFKPLHAMPVDRVTRKDIAAQLVAIKKPIVAAKARQAMMGLFAWAMQMGLVEANPVIGTKKPEEGKPRERVLSDSELVAVWNACRDDDFGKIVRLLICLGCRRQEVGGMCWSELDLEAPQPSWTLPAARSKNGRKHILPLMPLALGIIKSVPPMATRDCLFGRRSGMGFTKWDRCKRELDARSGVGSATLHDLRRTTATKLADIGVMPHIIEAVLNHQSGHKSGPAGIYNRSSYDREKRNALAQWEDHLRTLTAGGERKVLGFPQQ